MENSEILKIQVKVLKKLHFRLNGKCSQEGTTCPMNIQEDFGYDPFDIVWGCDECLDNFAFLIDPKRRKERIEKEEKKE